MNKPKYDMLSVLFGMMLTVLSLGAAYLIHVYTSGLHTHHFSNWGPMTEPRYVSTMWSAETSFPRQYRTCNDCGLTESRIVK